MEWSKIESTEASFSIQFKISGSLFGRDCGRQRPGIGHQVAKSLVPWEWLLSLVTGQGEVGDGRGK